MVWVMYKVCGEDGRYSGFFSKQLSYIREGSIIITKEVELVYECTQPPLNVV